MIPSLFSGDQRSRYFIGHGLGDLLDATDVVAKESSDDGHEWELSFNYPETGDLFKSIVINSIVLAKANSYQSPQAFRVYSIKKNLNHTINVSCQHISYDMSNIPVKPFKAETAATAVTKIQENKAISLACDHFTISTNVPDPTPDPTTDYYVLDINEPKSMLSILLDGDDSIVGKYGGDLVVDNYSIELKTVGGRDQFETIEYGKDLIDFTQEENIGEMITGILPYIVKQTNESLSLSVQVNAFVTTRNSAMVVTDKEYTLKAGYKYTLSFYTDERPNCTAYINPNCGFLASESGQVNLDGTRKDFEIEVTTDATYPSGTVIIYSNWLDSGSSNYGEIYDLKVNSKPIEPLMYGDVTYGPGTYTVQKIKPVDLTSFFSEDPTLEKLNAKAEEWVEKEEIGIPIVDLTLSYAFIDQDIRMYDAVRVRFVKMGVDTTAKVLSYTYDVLNERCTEITVGKAKDSLFFTLEDASRLRKGILPPDRIGKKSITSEKYARGSIGSESIGAGAVSSYNIEAYGINEDVIGEKAVSRRKFKNGGKDSVLNSVPDNVYGTYGGNVGYVFDPSMGVDWLQIPGWKDAQGHVIQPVTYHQDIPYNPDGSENPPGSRHAWGYMLAPDFIFNGSIDADKKVEPKTVTTKIIDDLAVTNDKIQDDAVDWQKTSQEIRAWHDDISNKTTNFGKIIGPTSVDVTADPVVSGMFFTRINFSTYYGTPYISFPGNLIFEPHILTFNGRTYNILSTSDINLDN